MEAAIYSHQLFIDNKSKIRFFKFIWAPDEFLFVTCLMNSPLRNRIVKDSLRFIDWTSGNSNPNSLTIDDFGKLNGSPKLFAGECDPIKYPESLEMIDQEILC
jgi:hypothetical protein